VNTLRRPLGRNPLFQVYPGEDGGASAVLVTHRTLILRALTFVDVPVSGVKG
jgi:hypothetical protein